MQEASKFCHKGLKINNFKQLNSLFKPVLRIRIHMITGILDPDPLARGMDPDLDPALDPDPSIIMQK
jgi:hypothetical protein